MEIIDRFLDLVENTEPTCIVGVNTSVAYEDEDGKPEAFACDVALQWYDDGLPVAEYGLRESYTLKVTI